MEDFQSFESVVFDGCDSVKHALWFSLAGADGGDLILSISEKAVFFIDGLNAFSGSPSDVIGLFAR